MADYSKYEDKELLIFIKEGSEPAFAEIYRRYFDPLYVNALRMLDDEAQAMDVVQDVFADLWDKRTSLAIRTSLQAYLYTSVRHDVLNAIRHRKVSDQYIENLMRYAGQELPMTDDHARLQELVQVIESEIARLPDKMRRVFELSRNEHQSHREIAETLHISEHTVKRQISNSLAILKERLSKWILLLVVFIFL